MKELFDIATQHTSREVAVGAVIQSDGKMVLDINRGAPPKAVHKGAKRSAKGSKKGLRRHPNGSPLLLEMATMTTTK
jgi:hypothetical protein